MNKKAIVTGGAGFVGSHLTETLVADGWSVVVIDDLSTGVKENVLDDERVTFVQKSITEPALVEHIEGADCVFHLAAQVSVQKSVEDPAGSHEVNVNGFLKVLEAMRASGVSRLVLVSSAAVYGSNASIPVREGAAFEPESPYGLQKAVSEQYAKLYQSLYGIETVIFRPFNLYGPRQRAESPYAGVVAKFVDLALKGEQPTIFGDGSNVRDFLCVHDAVRAFVLGATAPEAAGQVFNIGTGIGVTVLELAEKIYAFSGKECAPQFEQSRVGDISKSITDPSRIHEVLGWQAQVSLDEGLKELLKV